MSHHISLLKIILKIQEACLITSCHITFSNEKNSENSRKIPHPTSHFYIKNNWKKL
jgi:hypothetical protein